MLYEWSYDQFYQMEYYVNMRDDIVKCHEMEAERKNKKNKKFR